MKIYMYYLFIFLLIGCDKDYPNPDIVITLDRPFSLRNTPTHAVPKEKMDIAVYLDEETPKLTFILQSVIDHRCNSCIVPNSDFFVEILCNGKPYFLGDIRSLTTINPISPKAMPLEVDLGGFALRLVSVEQIKATGMLNQSAKYKEVTFILSKKL